MMVLFEGGPWNGEWIDMPEDLPSMYVVPEVPVKLPLTTDPTDLTPAMDTPMRCAIYSLKRRTDGRWVYVL